MWRTGIVCPFRVLMNVVTSGNADHVRISSTDHVRISSTTSGLDPLGQKGQKIKASYGPHLRMIMLSRRWRGIAWPAHGDLSQELAWRTRHVAPTSAAQAHRRCRKSSWWLLFGPCDEGTFSQRYLCHRTAEDPAGRMQAWRRGDCPCSPSFRRWTPRRKAKSCLSLISHFHFRRVLHCS